MSLSLSLSQSIIAVVAWIRDAVFPRAADAAAAHFLRVTRAGGHT